MTKDELRTALGREIGDLYVDDIWPLIVEFVEGWLRFYDEHPDVHLGPHTIADAWREEMA